MKNLQLTLVFLLAVAGRGFTQAGFLDPDFGDNGEVHTDFQGEEDIAFAILVQSDGKIVVAGSALIDKGICPADFDYALARYLPDGSLDPAFGAGGLVTADYGIGPEGCPAGDVALAAALQPDGKILLTGVSYLEFGSECLLLRYEPDGSLPSSGIYPVPFGNTDNIGSSLAVQPDGKIVLAATTWIDGNSDFALARLLPNGQPDPAFGAAGLVTTDFDNSADIANAVCLQTDGKVIVAGTSGPDIAVARYNSDGSLDNTFGLGGKITTDVWGYNDRGNAVTVQPDGRILVAGDAGRQEQCLGGTCYYEFVLARYNPGGSLDPSFGPDSPSSPQPGIVTTSIWEASDNGRAVALQPDGKVIVGGYKGITGLGGPDGDFALARYLADGRLDTSFHAETISTINPPGIVTTDFNSTYDGINSIALQGDGKLVAAGFAGPNFGLARYLLGPITPTRETYSLISSAFVYPNPATSEITLEYVLSQEESINIRLMDLRGRLMAVLASAEKRPRGKNRIVLHLPEELPAGSYLLAIHTAGEASHLLVVK